MLPPSLPRGPFNSSFLHLLFRVVPLLWFPSPSRGPISFRSLPPILHAALFRSPGFPSRVLVPASFPPALPLPFHSLVSSPWCSWLALPQRLFPLTLPSPHSPDSPPCSPRLSLSVCFLLSFPLPPLHPSLMFEALPQHLPPPLISIPSLASPRCCPKLFLCICLLPSFHFTSLIPLSQQCIFSFYYPSPPSPPHSTFLFLLLLRIPLSILPLALFPLHRNRVITGLFLSFHFTSLVPLFLIHGPFNFSLLSPFHSSFHHSSRLTSPHSALRHHQSLFLISFPSTHLAPLSPFTLYLLLFLPSTPLLFTPLVSIPSVPRPFLRASPLCAPAPLSHSPFMRGLAAHPR